MQTININIPSEESSGSKEMYWVVPFNDITPAKASSIIFYLKNTGMQDIKLDEIYISSTQKAAVVQVHAVQGIPEFTREQDIIPVNKNLGMLSVVPEATIMSCADADQVFSLGQLCRIDIKDENTMYETEPEAIISPEASIAITVMSEGTLSGVVIISQEVVQEE